jgi:hypothetical protein
MVMEKFEKFIKGQGGVIFGIVLAIVALASGFLIIINGARDKGPNYGPLCVQECNITLKYEKTKCSLVEEVDKYIKKVAPSSALDGYVITEECINNSIDICFVLAQGEQESHFGTTGLARKTNSVFNVFAFDGLKHNEICKEGKYKHPNYSVAPYIKLLKNDYLVDGKTEYDLLEPNNYVNKRGARYASSETYEKMLLDKYTKIKQNTKIDSLSQEANKYRLFLGI